MGITKIKFGYQKSVWDAPVAKSADDYLSQFNTLLQMREDAIRKIPSFNEYVDSAKKRQEEVVRIQAQFNQEVQSLLKTIDTRLESVDKSINAKKYPGLSASGNDKLTGAVEYNSALELLDNLTTTFPTAQIQRYYSQGRIDLLSAVIDEINDREQPALPPDVTAAYHGDVAEWKSIVNTIYRALGVNQLMIEQLQLQHVSKIISAKLQAANAGSDTNNTLILVTVDRAIYQADAEYNQKIAELNI